MSMDPDVQAAALRRLESRVSQLEDAISVYGPPDGRPLLGLRVPRVTLSDRQTTILVYSLFMLAIGVYTLAKLKRGEDPLS